MKARGNKHYEDPRLCTQREDLMNSFEQDIGIWCKSSRVINHLGKKKKKISLAIIEEDGPQRRGTCFKHVRCMHVLTPNHCALFL